MPLFPWPLFPCLEGSEGSSLWPSPTSVFANKGCPLVFPLVIYEYKSWIIKKDERRRTDAFEVWCWRRLLRVPWTARSHQLILKDINSEYSLEGLMLKLKLQYFSHLMGKPTHLRRSWCWERLKAGGEGDDRGWDGWMANSCQWTWVWTNFRMVKDREAWHAAVHGFAKSRTWLSDWTELNWRTLLNNKFSVFWKHLYSNKNVDIKYLKFYYFHFNELRI